MIGQVLLGNGAISLSIWVDEYGEFVGCRNNDNFGKQVIYYVEFPIYF